jgi:ParB family chromosome partitioning protein
MTTIDNHTWTIDMIVPSTENVREKEDNDIEGLLDSIIARGLIQPLVLDPEGNLIAGHRRRTAILKGITDGVLPADYAIPVYVKHDSTEDNSTQDMLIENMQREDLNPIEQARAFAKMQDRLGLSQRDIASKIGKSPALVSARIRLLDLPDTVINLLSADRLDLAIANEFTKVSDFPNDIENMVERKLDLNQVQNAVQRLKSERKVLELARLLEDQGATVYTSHRDMAQAGYLPDYDASITNPSKEDVAAKVDDGDHVLIAQTASGLVLQIGKVSEPTQKSERATEEDELAKAKRAADRARRAAIGDAIRTQSPAKAEVEGFVDEYLCYSVGQNVAKMACRFIGLVDAEIMEEQGVTEKFSIGWGRALAVEIAKGGRAATQAKMALAVAYTESNGSERNDMHLTHGFWKSMLDALQISLDSDNAPVQLD